MLSTLDLQKLTSENIYLLLHHQYHDMRLQIWAEAQTTSLNWVTPNFFISHLITLLQPTFTCAKSHLEAHLSTGRRRLFVRHRLEAAMQAKHWWAATARSCTHSSCTEILPQCTLILCLWIQTAVESSELDIWRVLQLHLSMPQYW